MLARLAVPRRKKLKPADGGSEQGADHAEARLSDSGMGHGNTP